MKNEKLQYAIMEDVVKLDELEHQVNRFMLMTILSIKECSSLVESILLTEGIDSIKEVGYSNEVTLTKEEEEVALEYLVSRVNGWSIDREHSVDAYVTGDISKEISMMKSLGLDPYKMVHVAYSEEGEKKLREYVRSQKCDLGDGIKRKNYYETYIKSYVAELQCCELSVMLSYAEHAGELTKGMVTMALEKVTELRTLKEQLIQEYIKEECLMSNEYKESIDEIVKELKDM